MSSLFLQTGKPNEPIGPSLVSYPATNARIGTQHNVAMSYSPLNILGASETISECTRPPAKYPKACECLAKYREELLIVNDFLA
ncbi:hypothetical protein [Lacipirellula limnantheis]|uniref:Uncharacterized protein n=1 Tax=Lacipirellula limnantheis TaxID=2528024 RepID=A0A517TRG6_9BACT|nr:hypothetical protein [Lacipirellula limnantheis]QDT70973.1 hypothetical protein I41_01280 [Lacipirellula limnantheis]